MSAILQGCGTPDQLGRRTQAKIKGLLKQYAKQVEISKQDYDKMLIQVNGYKTATVQLEATEIDQPPRRNARTPSWVQEAEQAQTVQEREIIKSAAKRPPLTPI